MKEDTSLFDGRLSKAECDLINLEENIRTAQEKLNIVAADTSRLEEENANGANVMADLGNEMLTSKRSSESSKENGNHQTISATSEISRRNWSERINQMNDTAADTSTRGFILSGRVSALETSSSPFPFSSSPALHIPELTRSLNFQTPSMPITKNKPTKPAKTVIITRNKTRVRDKTLEQIRELHQSRRHHRRSHHSTKWKSKP